MKQVEERYISLLTDFDRLFEEAEIAKFTPQEMRQYEASKKAYRDIKNSIDTAKQEGLAEGIEIGMEKGMKEGMEKGMSQRSLEIAKKMQTKGMDEASIMDMTGLTAEEIKLLKAEMQITNITILSRVYTPPFHRGIQTLVFPVRCGKRHCIMDL